MNPTPIEFDFSSFIKQIAAFTSLINSLYPNIKQHLKDKFI